MPKKTLVKKANSPARIERLQLQERLSICEAHELKQTLISAQDAAAIELDGAAISQVDTPAIQLLISFFAARTARGLSTCWCSASQELRDVASLLGVSNQLALNASE